MTNASPFFEYISQITPISADAKTAILNVLEQKIYHKKEFLLSQKTVSNSIYFIKKGCIREFLINSKNKEIDIYFGFENDIISSLSSFISEKPSSTSIQAIETTHTLEISRKNLHELYEKYIEIERLGRLITEKYFIASELYYHEFHHLSALERFENLIKQKPYLTQRVPLSMIASYIGISNSTLSRLRAKRLY